MIYLVRHGEAAAAWGEHPDPGLSKLGHQQAADVAQVLNAQTIMQAKTSPMQRCQETAQAFSASTGLTADITPSVTEIPTPQNIGDRRTWLRALMSGTWEEAPQLIQTWRNNLIETVSNLPPQTVVFTHFVAINALASHCEGYDEVTVFRPTYCSITRLEQIGNDLILRERGSEASTRVL